MSIELKPHLHHENSEVTFCTFTNRRNFPQTVNEVHPESVERQVRLNKLGWIANRLQQYPSLTNNLPCKKNVKNN